MAVLEQYNQMHFVGFSSYKDAIKPELISAFSQISWHNNIYETLAEVIISSCNAMVNSQIAVCILIDSLTDKQLTVFECLAELDHIEPLAVSSVNNRDKLQLAIQLGAIQCLEMGLIFQNRPEPSGDDSIQMDREIIEIPTKPKIVVKQYPVKNACKKTMSNSQKWKSSNVVKAHVFEQMTEPKLTEKELDDLLK
ncbi:MAG: hypothetical protein JEZ07_02405 [Phycisphaerae bacterium]|nr:hypothetical protein [Phycisphaerae bacterium]